MTKTKKWDEKMERDLLMAMRIGESGYRPVTKATWQNITAIMQQMGYTDATVSNPLSYFVLYQNIQE